MTTLSNFEREMKAEARKAPNEFVRERHLNMAANARALANPVNEEQERKLKACLRHLASGIAAHRQAQGGGR